MKSILLYYFSTFVFLSTFGNVFSTNSPLRCSEISVTFQFHEYDQWNVTASATISVYRKKDNVQYISISNFTVNSGFTHDSATSYCVSEICTSDFDKPFEIAVKNTTLEVTAFFPTYSFGLYDVSVDDDSFYGEEGYLFDMMDNKCLSDFYNQTNLETTTTQCCTTFQPASQAPINTPKCKIFQSRTSILDVDNNFSVDGTSTMKFLLNGNDITGSGSITGSNGHEYIATYYVDDSTCNGHPESNNITCSPFTLPDGDSLALIRVNYMELNGSRYDSSFDGMVGRILIRNGQTLMEEGKPFTATNNCFYINYSSDSHPFSQVITNSFCCAQF
uniref:Uncharacterized protein n=1 Tax=Panagrolaimus sp. ES5 TaxID=591445 RepID=A0AC34GSW1_9BILA